jgi:hypothetical protein
MRLKNNKLNLDKKELTEKILLSNTNFSDIISNKNITYDINNEDENDYNILI